MSIRLYHTWKTYDIGSIAGTLTPTAVAVNWSIPYGKYLTPYEISSSFIVVSSAVNTLSDRLNNGVSDPSYVYECYYDNSINRVVLSCSVLNVGITFNSNAQTIFGFDSSYGSWSVITGSNAPFGIWTSTQENRAKDSDVYEQDAFIEERIADNGRAYSTGRVTVGQFRDWEFLNEPKENVFIKYAATGSYPWESFVKNIRKSADFFTLHDNVTKPLVTFEDREAVYLLKEERTGFKPKQIMPDYIEHWHVPVNTRVYLPKHKDEREYPPGSVCELPGIVSAVSPTDGETFLFFPPEELEWSTDFDYGSSNPNSYQVFVKEGSPSYDFPVATTDETSQSISATVGDVYWRINSSNQCGSRVSDNFTFTTAGASISQSAITTDAAPYLYASGSGQAFSGSNTDHTFDYYGANEPRDIATKVGQSGSWVIVESETIETMGATDLTTWTFSQPLGSTTTGSIDAPLNSSGSYSIEGIRFFFDNSGSIEINDPNVGTWQMSPLGGVPATFSMYVKLDNTSQNIIGIRLRNDDDDMNVYVGIEHATGHLAYGNNNASYGTADDILSGSTVFNYEGIDWAYCWFSYTPNDLYLNGTCTIYPVATTGSINDTWTNPPSSVNKCDIAYPQVRYIAYDGVNLPGWFHLANGSVIATEAGSTTMGITKSVDTISASFIPAFIASGSAMKIRLVPNYSSSHSNVDRPVITFSGSSQGLKFKTKSLNYDLNGNLVAQMTTASGSYTGSWDLGFIAGEKTDIIIDHDYKRVDWYQSSGYQNHFYFTGSWQENTGSIFYLGSSGSSKFAFDGLMNVSLTSSNPNAPFPPSGSNVEAELIAESIMWFDAAKGVTLSGAYLQTWNDQSPRGMIAERSAGAITNNAMEYYLTGGIGGEPGVFANALGEYGVSGSMFDVSGSSWFTLYVVYDDLDTTSNTIRYHFDIYNDNVSSRRRIVVQRNARRPGNWTGAFNVGGPGAGFTNAADRYANTGSQCFTYVMQGNETGNIIDFNGTTTIMYKDRGLFGRVLTNNIVNHPENWVNLDNDPATFSLLGAWNEAGGQRAHGNYSLICAFSGSHNETERQRVWDYIEGRFGVAQTLTPNYAFTSGTMPYQYTDWSLIPSASINPDFFNKAYQIEFTLSDIVSQFNHIWVNEDDGARLTITNTGGGAVRQYVAGGGFYTMGTLSGSNVGDRIRILVDWERGSNIMENITQNKCCGWQNWTAPISMSYGNIQWLYFTPGSEGLASGSWNIYAPDLNIGY